MTDVRSFQRRAIVQIRPELGRFGGIRGKWLALLLILLVIVGFGARNIRTHGVFWSRTQAHFLLPRSSASPNGLITVSAPLVDVAGLVGRLVDPSAVTVDVNSQTITLADEGIKHGYSVTLPNSGGQFSTIFNTPALDVQAVGTTASEVSNRMTELIRRIVTTLNKLQDDRNVRKVDRITVQSTPPVAPTFYQKGSPLRAVAAIVVLALSLTLGTVAMATRDRRRVLPYLERRGSAGSNWR